MLFTDQFQHITTLLSVRHRSVKSVNANNQTNQHNAKKESTKIKDKI